MTDDAASSDIICPSCGAGGCVETVEAMVVPRGLPEDPKPDITVRIPVGHCPSCDFEWRDWRADSLIDGAIFLQAQAEQAVADAKPREKPKP
jgi:hypothetical protein